MRILCIPVWIPRVCRCYSFRGTFSCFFAIVVFNNLTDFIGCNGSLDLYSGRESSGGRFDDEEFEGGGLTGLEVTVDAFGVAAGDEVLDLVDCALGQEGGG